MCPDVGAVLRELFHDRSSDASIRASNDCVFATQKHAGNPASEILSALVIVFDENICDFLETKGHIDMKANCPVVVC